MSPAAMSGAEIIPQQQVASSQLSRLKRRISLLRRHHETHLSRYGAAEASMADQSHQESSKLREKLANAKGKKKRPEQRKENIGFVQPMQAAKRTAQAGAEAVKKPKLEATSGSCLADSRGTDAEKAAVTVTTGPATAPKAPFKSEAAALMDDLFGETNDIDYENMLKEHGYDMFKEDENGEIPDIGDLSRFIEGTEEEAGLELDSNATATASQHRPAATNVAGADSAGPASTFLRSMAERHSGPNDAGCPTTTLSAVSSSGHHVTKANAVAPAVEAAAAATVTTTVVASARSGGALRPASGRAFDHPDPPQHQPSFRGETGPLLQTFVGAGGDSSGPSGIRPSVATVSATGRPGQLQTGQTMTMQQRLKMKRQMMAEQFRQQQQGPGGMLVPPETLSPQYPTAAPSPLAIKEEPTHSPMTQQPMTTSRQQHQQQHQQQHRHHRQQHQQQQEQQRTQKHQQIQHPQMQQIQQQQMQQQQMPQMQQLQHQRMIQERFSAQQQQIMQNPQGMPMQRPQQSDMLSHQQSQQQQSSIMAQQQQQQLMMQHMHRQHRQLATTIGGGSHMQRIPISMDVQHMAGIPANTYPSPPATQRLSVGSSQPSAAGLQQGMMLSAAGSATLLRPHMVGPQMMMQQRVSGMLVRQQQQAMMAAHQKATLQQQEQIPLAGFSGYGMPAAEGESQSLHTDSLKFGQDGIQNMMTFGRSNSMPYQ